MKKLTGSALLFGLLLTATSFAAPAGLESFTSTTLAGTIYQNPTSSSQPIATTPLTLSLLLALLGHPTVKPASTAFFFDTGSNSLILASKDGGTTYGTLYTIPTDGGAPQTTIIGKENQQIRSLQKASALNGLFNGTIFGNVKVTPVKKGLHQMGKLTFTGEGSVDANSTPDALLQFTFTVSNTSLRQ